MNFKKLGIFLSGLLLIGGLSGCMSKSGEKEILNYLEEKYNEEFVIENYKSANKLVNQYGGGKAIVYSKTNKDLLFIAGKANSENEKYYDTYSFVKLAEEIKDELKETVNKNIEADSDYTVVVYSLGNYDNEEIINMTTDEYIEYDKDRLDIRIKIAIEIERNEEVSKYYKGIFNILNDIKAYGTKDYGISIGFVENIKDTEEYLKTANIVDGTWDNIGKGVIGKIIVNQRSNINTSEDFNNYYKILEE